VWADAARGGEYRLIQTEGMISSVGAKSFITTAIKYAISSYGAVLVFCAASYKYLTPTEPLFVRLPAIRLVSRTRFEVAKRYALPLPNMRHVHVLKNARVMRNMK